MIGTNFDPATARHKKQELESWLLQKLEPKIDFTFHSFTTEDLPVVILEIQAASHVPVKFEAKEYILSRVIKQAITAGKIVPYDEKAGSKAMRYIPWWA